MASFLILALLLTSLFHVNAFPRLARRSDEANVDGVSASVSATISISAPAYTWLSSQLVDVTGDHAYADPLPGQARGPCPAQNALANHGYLDRSGYTNFEECVAANGQVYNMFPDFAAFLCFLGQLTGGDLIGATWSIGNSSTFDSSIQAACPCSGFLGCVLASLVCYISNILDKALGTAGFGMAQTHNSVRRPPLLPYPLASHGTTLSNLGTLAMLWFDCSGRDSLCNAYFRRAHTRCHRVYVPFTDLPKTLT